MIQLTSNLVSLCGSYPDKQNQINYSHGSQPIAFQDAIIDSPNDTVVDQNSISSCNTDYMGQSHEQQDSLDLKPLDCQSIYCTEPSYEMTDEDIKSNIDILSTYFNLSYDLIEDKNTIYNHHVINSLEILKLRILNEKNVLNEFVKFIRQFNPLNDKSRRLYNYEVDAENGGSVQFIFEDLGRADFYVQIYGTDKVELVDKDGEVYCTNRIEFQTYPH